MSAENTYEGACFCEAVKWKATGEAFAMGYCHCNSCRTWSGGPVNAFTLWKPEEMTFLQGEELVATFDKGSGTKRSYCTKCGGHVMCGHPSMGFIDLYQSALPTYPFKPTMHIFYEETVLRIKDGLPKMKDVPAEMGGSGETLPE